jgi:hypothetical protein
MSALVISGNGVTPASCPFFPSKQTFVRASGTSAMCHLADLIANGHSSF